MNNQGTMRIGEVHAILRRDVPDIELSKIRYYEDKGLVQPTRSRKGYRLYSERDVECLREAIRLAHEEFVPLRVVRLRLIEQGLLDDGPVAANNRQVARTTSSVISVPVPASEPGEDVVDDEQQPPEPVAVTSVMSASPVVREEPALKVTVPVTTSPAVATAPTLEPVAAHDARHAARESRVDQTDIAALIQADEWDEDRFYSPSEFLVVSGLEANIMNQLVASGLLSPVTIAGQATFSEMDLRVARAIKVLLARNVDIRLLGSLRRNVERELGLLNDVIQPVRPTKKSVSARETRDHAKSVALEIAALRAELFARALHHYLGR
jgi:DNA-binding transcriptional MerR regulator